MLFRSFFAETIPNDILVGHRYHTAGSEPYFFGNSYNYLGAIPVGLNGRCVVAKIGDRDKDTMCPLKRKCTKSGPCSLVKK